MTKKYSKQFNDFVDKYCTKNSTADSKEYTISVDYEHFSQFKKSKLKIENIRIANRMLPRNVLVSMISQYDAFVRSLLIIFYSYRPELVNQFEKTYRYSDIAAYKSIGEFRTHVFEKAAEACIRESHEEQFKQISKIFAIVLDKDLPSFSSFIEICERRNLFVHCDGIVSEQYLQASERHNFTNKPKSISEKLECNHEYVISSYRILVEIGVKLSLVLWKKLIPHTNDEADSLFTTITFDLIDSAQYELAEELLTSGLKMWDTKFSSDEYKLVSQINLAQTYKWQGKSEDCRNLLKKRDWAALDAKYRLSRHVLLEQWEDAVSLMDQVANSNSISDVDYRDWPLFKELVRQPNFLKKFKEIYKKEFENILYDESESTLSKARVKRPRASKLPKPK